MLIVSLELMGRTELRFNQSCYSIRFSLHDYRPLRIPNVIVISMEHLDILSQDRSVSQKLHLQFCEKVGKNPASENLHKRTILISFLHMSHILMKKNLID